MRRAWMSFSLLFGCLILLHRPLFAQDDADPAQQRAQTEQEKQALEAQRKSQKALADFLRSSRSQIGTSNGLNSLYFQFRTAIPKFRSAVDEYRWMLSMRGKLDKHLKEMGTQTEVMLKYMSNGRVNHPKVDPSEFKDYSATELQWETLNSKGAVSREVVLEMARGARKALHADIAVSVSGIAGPGGAMPEKPVGTTWIGLVSNEGEWARVFQFSGARVQNKSHAAEAALQMLFDHLQGRPMEEGPA